MGLGSSVGDTATQLADRQAREQKEGLQQIQTAFAGFNPDFYNRVQQDYVNWADPQLQSQYLNQRKQMEGSLAGQGLTRSSAAANDEGSLRQELAKQQRGVEDAGLQTAQSFEQSVQGQENTLVNQMMASSDPLSIAQGALTTAASIKAPSLFAPVGNFFTNWANNYAANKSANALVQNNNLLNNVLQSGVVGTGDFGFSSGAKSGVIN